MNDYSSIPYLDEDKIMAAINGLDTTVYKFRLGLIAELPWIFPK